MGEVSFLLCGMLAFLVCFVLVLSLTSTFPLLSLLSLLSEDGVYGQRNVVSLGLDSV